MKILNKETLKALLGMRLSQELRTFRDEELGLDKDEILGDCFKINMFIVIYEILIESMNQMKKGTISELLDRQGNIISQIYESWLEENGDDYERIKQFVEKEVA